MIHSEQTDGGALPLARAAARLGITPDALRMRLRRGTARGFKRAGRLFVYLSERPGERGDPARRGGGPPAPEGGAAARSDDRAEAGPAGVRGESLSVVIEFQKIELSRVLRENRQSNQRIDQLLEELKHLRQMQQREQILRQQEQALREQLQGLVDRLAERLALPAPEPAPAASEARQASPEAGAPRADPPPERRVEPFADPSVRSSPRPRPEDRRPLPSDSTRPGPAGPAPRSEVEATALAEILRDVGRSLRALEETPDSAAEPESPRAGADAPRASPPPTGERRQAGSELAPGWPFDLVEPGAAGTDLADISAAEQASLLEILGHAATTDDERRNAARIMRRLLRSRANRPRTQDEG